MASGQGAELEGRYRRAVRRGAGGGQSVADGHAERPGVRRGERFQSDGPGDGGGAFAEEGTLCRRVWCAGGDDHEGEGDVSGDALIVADEPGATGGALGLRFRFAIQGLECNAG